MGIYCKKKLHVLWDVLWKICMLYGIYCEKICISYGIYCEKKCMFCGIYCEQSACFMGLIVIYLHVLSYILWTVCILYGIYCERSACFIGYIVNYQFSQQVIVVSVIFALVLRRSALDTQSVKYRPDFKYNYINSNLLRDKKSMEQLKHMGR